MKLDSIGKYALPIGVAIFSMRLIHKGIGRTNLIGPLIIPEAVIKIMDKLESNGYDALIVGGAVRDSLLGINPKDYDLSSDATPDEVEDVVKELENYKYLRTPEANVARGALTSLVLTPDDEVIEITTYRSELGYEKGNRSKPIAIPAESFEEDAKRRDFTINSMAMNKHGELVDPMGGVRDLKGGVIRAVGDANERFNEDPLRMIRAIRFATRLNFKIETDTKNAILSNAYLVKTLSKSRLRLEIEKVLVQPNGFKMLMDLNIIPTIIPEMRNIKDYVHSLKYHTEGNLYNHYIEAFKLFNDNPNKTELGAWALLFHDIAKPTTAKWNGSYHTFIGHDKVGSQIVLDNYNYQKGPIQFNKKELTAIAWVTKNHLAPFWNMTNKLKVAKLANNPNFSLLVEVAKADAMGLNDDLFQSRLDYFEEITREVKSRKSKVGNRPKDFALRVFEELNIPPSIERKNVMVKIEELISSGTASSYEEALNILKESL